MIDGVELEGLEYLAVNHQAFQNKTLSDKFWGIFGRSNPQLLKADYDKIYAKITIGGQQYYDIGKHLYYDGSNLSDAGERHQQATEETKVGIQLVSNYNKLHTDPPSDYETINYSFSDKESVEQTRADALKFKNCKGVCWAVSQARLNQAYVDIFGENAIDLSYSNKNIDHVLSATSKKLSNPFYRYGVGGALANRGLGTMVDDPWDGSLQLGAMVQVWLGETAGHSQIFLSYDYDENGKIKGMNLIDNLINNNNYYSVGTSEDIKAVNLKDK